LSSAKPSKKKPPKWLADLSPEDAYKEIAYVRDTVKLLRKYSDSFSPEEGFNLRDVKSFSASRLKEIRAKGAHIRQLLSRPHKVVRPRSSTSEKALQNFTRQKIKGQKAWIVHTDQPDKKRVKVVKGAVEVQKPVKGGVIRERFYLLPKSGRNADQVLKMLEKMLPDLPDGHYIAINKRYGAIGGSIERKLLLREMEDQLYAYQKREEAAEEFDRKRRDSYARAIIGFQWLGPNLAAAQKWRRRVTAEREAYQSHRLTMRNRQRADVLKKYTKRRKK